MLVLFLYLGFGIVIGGWGEGNFEDQDDKEEENSVYSFELGFMISFFVC